MRIDAGIDFNEWPGEVHECIEYVQACASHAAPRRLAWIVTPAAFYARRMLVAEIALDMKDVTKHPVSDHAFELAHAP